MAGGGGDEWIYVLAKQEEDKEAEAVGADDAAATATGEGEEKPSDSNDDGDGQGSPSPQPSNDGDAARTDEVGATMDGEEEARSDGGSYGSMEVNDYLDYIEGEEEDDPATVDGGGDVLEAAKGIFDLAVKIEEALQIAESASAEARRASTGGRGEAVVVENPYYDCYGDKPQDAEDYGNEYGSGYSSNSDSVSYPLIGSYGYGYGYGGDAYATGPVYGGYGGDAYGSGLVYSGYGNTYGYGYGGYGGYYSGEPAYAARYTPPPVVYRAPPAYGTMPWYPPPYMYCQYLAPVPAHRYGPAYVPPYRPDPPPRADEPSPPAGRPRPPHYLLAPS